MALWPNGDILCLTLGNPYSYHSIDSFASSHWLILLKISPSSPRPHLLPEPLSPPFPLADASFPFPSFHDFPPLTQPPPLPPFSPLGLQYHSAWVILTWITVSTMMIKGVWMFYTRHFLTSPSEMTPPQMNTLTPGEPLVPCLPPSKLSESGYFSGDFDPRHPPSLGGIAIGGFPTSPPLRLISRE
ncbi:hypothetical protein M5K25_015072 [Dendrobium thyrsiflorum]|uniref:Uncharacterized protein n=1 Tax=Dendrobium thyrsiflorum TaxID=117978 RepID=A0ABD0UPE0_DENTH